MSRLSCVSFRFMAYCITNCVFLNPTAAFSHIRYAAECRIQKNAGEKGERKWFTITFWRQSDIHP